MKAASALYSELSSTRSNKRSGYVGGLSTPELMRLHKHLKARSHPWAKITQTHLMQRLGLTIGGTPVREAQLHIGPRHGQPAWHSLVDRADAQRALGKHGASARPRVSIEETQPASHHCRACGHKLWSAGHRGFTSTTATKSGQSAWRCPSCGLDFHAAKDRPIRESTLEEARWRPGEQLSDPQRKERVTAAIARWKGHTKSMPPELQRAAKTVAGSSNIASAVSSLYQRRPALHSAVMQRLGQMPDRHFAGMHPQDLERLRVAVQSDPRRPGRAGAETHPGGRLAKRLDSLKKGEVKPSEAPVGAQWLAGPISNIERVGGETHTSEVFKGVVGGRQVFIKPRHGIPTGKLREGITPGKDLEREHAGSLVAHAMGIDAPKGALRDVPGHGMSWVSEGVGTAGGDELLDLAKYPDDLYEKLTHDMALLDCVVGNSDRHQDNCQITEAPGHPELTKVHPIDHSNAFPDRPFRERPGKANFAAIQAQKYSMLTRQDKARLRGVLSNSELFERLEHALPGSAGPTRARVEMMLDQGSMPYDFSDERARGNDFHVQDLLLAGFEEQAPRRRAPRRARR